MSMFARRSFLIGAALAPLASAPAHAQASGTQVWPARPVMLIIPFPAGGAMDLLGRGVAQDLADKLGQQFVVDNRAGAAGNIGAMAAAKASPDGYTILMAGAASLALNKFIFSNMPYDPETELTPIVILSRLPHIFVVNARVEAKTLKELVDYAKANPGKLNYASAGNGTLPHVTMELLLRRLALDVTHIPYRGAAPAMTDLLAGQVQLKMDTYATAAPQVAAGRLRALAYAGRARSALMPDVPAIAEMLPGYEGVLWMGLVAPAGTPQSVIETLAAAVKRAVGSADLAERLKRDGIDPVGGAPQEFGAQIAREITQWRELAKSVDIKLD